MSGLELIACPLFAVLAGCSRPPAKQPAPAASCFHTSAHKDWTEPADCRRFDEIAPVFTPDADAGPPWEKPPGW